MKKLVENNGYELCYAPELVNKYHVYVQCKGFKQEVARSSVLSKKIKSYFTNVQVNTAIAKVHAFKLVNRKFKA